MVCDGADSRNIRLASTDIRSKSGGLMKRLLTTLVILTGLIGSGGAVWADARSDFIKGYDAYKTGGYVEAAKWYRKAAEQGHTRAAYRLGNMYKGLGAQLVNAWGVRIGVKKDNAESAKWYRKAAEQGHVLAQTLLG